MATEKRLIDIEYLEPYAVDIFGTKFIPYAALRDVATVDAVEVVHGRWKPYHEADIGYDEYGVRCSKCGFDVEDHEVKFIMHYCPNCGAKMDGGDGK